MNETKTKIMDLAEHLIQVNGFNGFSYLDLANEIGIKTASIHYYFKSKDDLAVALVERLHGVYAEAFEDMDANIKTPQKRLKALIESYKAYIGGNKFCLCGMMSAEMQSVSPKVRKLLNICFTDFQAWLTRQFKAMGHKDAKTQGLRFLSMLEGALLLARVKGDPKIIGTTLKVFVS